MKITKRQLWWSLLGLGLAGGLAYAFRPQPVGVDVARVARGTLRVTVEAEGKTRLKDRYVVSAPLAGRLLRVELKAGDAVEAGRTLLAAIEPADPELLDPRARAEAEARVKAAEAAQARAGPLLGHARTAAEYARTELERAQRLYAASTVSHQDLDNAEQRERLTADELKSAEFAAQIAAFELEQARAALLGGPASGSASARFELGSPITGRVLRVFQESSTVVPAGARLLELGDPANLEVEVEVLSGDAVKIPTGAKVFLEHWGGEAPLPARVRMVEPSAFTKISALGVEEQRVYVIADFTGPPAARRAVGDGFRVEARIVVAEGENILKVPTGALFREGGDWAVFVAQGGRAVLQKIQIDRRNDLEAEVLSGLDEGATVIIHPSDRVSDGVRVRLPRR
jgi:HlyD family secretion protein